LGKGKERRRVGRESTEKEREGRKGEWNAGRGEGRGRGEEGREGPPESFLHQPRHKMLNRPCNSVPIQFQGHE